MRLYLDQYVLDEAVPPDPRREEVERRAASGARPRPGEGGEGYHP